MSIDEIDRAAAATAASSDAAARVEGLVTAIQEEVAANEAGFRSLLQLSVAQSPSDRPNVASIRGERRLQWIDQALEPIAAELDAPARRRLTGALALCVGAEGFLVLRDLCGHDREEAEDTLRWAARALLTAARNDARAAARSAAAERKRLDRG